MPCRPWLLTIFSSQKPLKSMEWFLLPTAPQQYSLVSLLQNTWPQQVWSSSNFWFRFKVAVLFSRNSSSRVWSGPTSVKASKMGNLWPWDLKLAFRRRAFSHPRRGSWLKHETVWTRKGHQRDWVIVSGIEIRIQDLCQRYASACDVCIPARLARLDNGQVCMSGDSQWMSTVKGWKCETVLWVSAGEGLATSAGGTGLWACIIRGWIILWDEQRQYCQTIMFV